MRAFPHWAALSAPGGHCCPSHTGSTAPSPPGNCFSAQIPQCKRTGGRLSTHPRVISTVGPPPVRGAAAAGSTPPAEAGSTDTCIHPSHYTCAHRCHTRIHTNTVDHTCTQMYTHTSHHTCAYACHAHACQCRSHVHTCHAHMDTNDIDLCAHTYMHTHLDKIKEISYSQ